MTMNCNREFSRIPRFCLELSYMWQKDCPDIRFGQLMYIIFKKLENEGIDPFYIEDEEMMEHVRKYFDDIDW